MESGVNRYQASGVHTLMRGTFKLRCVRYPRAKIPVNFRPSDPTLLEASNAPSERDIMMSRV